MTEVRFYDPLYEPGGVITYSIISARYRGKWIFVRHNGRTTWEISGGHIEKDESPLDAAGRELMEETGALRFRLECAATYSVEEDGRTGYGRLYLADVTEIGSFTDRSEIAEVALLDSLPDDLTYPVIQTALFRKCIEFSERQERSR